MKTEESSFSLPAVTVFMFVMLSYSAADVLPLSSTAAVRSKRNVKNDQTLHVKGRKILQTARSTIYAANLLLIDNSSTQITQCGQTGPA